MNKKTALIFARSNHGAVCIECQVGRLRAYAAAHGYRVLGTIGLPHTSANDEQVEASLTGLIAKSRDDARERVVLVTDLSRLVRDATRGLHLIQRLLVAGWIVISTDGGDMNRISAELFCEKNKKKELGDPNAKDNAAGDSADAEADDGR